VDMGSLFPLTMAAVSPPVTTGVARTCTVGNGDAAGVGVLELLDALLPQPATPAARMMGSKKRAENGFTGSPEMVQSKKNPGAIPQRARRGS
jgi:hypothetical protein